MNQALYAHMNNKRKMKKKKLMLTLKKKKRKKIESKYFKKQVTLYFLEILNLKDRLVKEGTRFCYN
jgi:hypothetical protein